MQISAPLAAARQALLSHPVLPCLKGVQAWRIFMEHHVFAVWDFMSILKRLQRDLTQVQLPWSPRPSARYARFVNELVLAEESDEDGAGGYSSHFELYLQAMQECGANSQPIRAFIKHLGAGHSPSASLAHIDAPASVRQFVEGNLQVALEGSLAEVCANFFWGREEIIPAMFAGLLHELQSAGHTVRGLRYYFERHIELDGDSHGPLAAELVAHACGNNAALQNAAQAAATEALEHRYALWSTVHAGLETCRRPSRATHGCQGTSATPSR